MQRPLIPIDHLTTCAFLTWADAIARTEAPLVGLLYGSYRTT